MSCFRPMDAYRRPDGTVGIGSDRGDGRWMELPCGRCIGCKQERARAWAIRITHEAQLYDSNLFLTLTYSDAALPASLSLEYPHFSGFMKRLRRRLKGVSRLPDGGRPIRFFMCGEYGEVNSRRPHYHAILFNCDFPDKVPLHNGEWHSALAEDLWDRGIVTIGSLNAARAAYVAGYTLKKRYGRGVKDGYEDVVNLSTGELTSRGREFVSMSRMPGIGALWYRRFGSDLFPQDQAVQAGRCYKVPRYYYEIFKREADPAKVEEIMESRFLRAMEHPEESTPERRAVREELAWRRVATFRKRAL